MSFSLPTPLQSSFYNLLIFDSFHCRKLVIGVDQTDDNYMPSRILVYGTTENGQSKMLNETRIDWYVFSVCKICLDQIETLSVLQNNIMFRFSPLVLWFVRKAMLFRYMGRLVTYPQSVNFLCLHFLLAKRVLLYVCAVDDSKFQDFKKEIIYKKVFLIFSNVFNIIQLNT